MKDRQCFIGVDVGLTSAKASAFDRYGDELVMFKAENPRAAVAADRQEIDMLGLWHTVTAVLSKVTAWAAAHSFDVQGLGVTGHGNGLYPVDENLRPVRPAFASTDNRAEHIVARYAGPELAAERSRTGSVPWAGQPAVLLRWMLENEPQEFARTRWALSCKDWITSCLTGVPSADVSDASAMGLLDLATGSYDPAVFARLELPADTLERFPVPRRSNEVVGGVNGGASSLTGLPEGTPVVAGCMDCIASPLGAGSTRPRDVTIIVGTWAINSVVVPSTVAPPRVTLNALLPDPGLMLAQEVAPTSAASLEWLSGVISTPRSGTVTPQDLLQAAGKAPAGSDGLLFLPFVHGSPDFHGASGTLIGAKGLHTHAHVARAVAEGVAQYHRVQLEKLQSSGAAVTEEPWTLAGGGARNPFWAQIFADIIGHPVRRQLGTELGARGVASLVYEALGGDRGNWRQEHDASLLVEPGVDVPRYRRQAKSFDSLLTAMAGFWTESDRERRAEESVG